MLEKLASGGMAEVFLARSSGAGGVGKFAAIKRILPQYSDATEFIEMFKDEAKVAVNLSHSNIVSIYEFGVEQRQFYLVMDYIEGRNMRQFLNRMKKDNNNFSIDQVVYIIKEVAAGLDHAHRCLDGTTGKPLNIIHRDISPQNIMISFEGEVKVVDFGIAKAESQVETTKAGALKGKFGYMSPEQVEGLPVDLRTDIFSLGIVLWELLANDRLFIANNEVNTLRKVRECVVPSLRKINPAVSPELEQIVQRALAKDRNLRYQTCAELHKDLNRFLNRHFPDFVPQEFATFTKSLFSDEIVETRKRLVQYAREAQETEKTTIVLDDKTMATGSVTDAGAEKSDFLQVADVSQHQVDISQLRLDTSRLNQSTGKATPVATGTFNRTSTSPRSEKPNARSRQKQAVGLNLSAIVMVVLIAAGGAFLFKSLGLGPFRTPDSTTNELERPTTPEKTPAVPSAPQQVSVLVVSEPTGAEVYVDGASTGVITPATIRVDNARAVVIEARMENHLPASVSVDKPQSGQRIELKLRAAVVGFLDISVMPGGAAVFIDNQEIAQKPPVKKLPVEANKPVQVKAFNKSTGAYDEVEVTVGANQVQRLTLFPKTPEENKEPASLK